MSRSFPPAKSVLAPLVVAALAFGVAWNGPAAIAFFSRSAPPQPRPFREADAGGRLQAVQHDLHGLARRRELTALLLTPSLSTQEKLRTAGMSNSFDSPALLTEMARRDPEGTWKMTLEHGTDVSGEVLREWLRHDPQALVTAFATIPDRMRESLNREACRLLQDKDPQIAATIAAHLDLFDPVALTDIGIDLANCLLKLPPSASRDALIASQGKSTGDDWLETSHWAATLPPDLRAKVEENLARDALLLPGSTSAPFLAWASQWLSRDASPAIQQRLGADYVEVLAATNPEAALAWANAHLSGYPLVRAIGSAVAARFATDPEAACALVGDLPPGGVQSQAATQVAARWIELDPVAALLWWSGFPRSPDGADEFYPAARRWALQHPEEFRQFLSDPATPALPESVIQGGIVEVSARDRADTLDWLASLEGENRTTALDCAFADWASADPEAAAARLSQQPDLMTRRGTLLIASALYSHGSDRDPAVNWIATLPEGPIRDTVVSALRERVADDEGLTALRKQALLKKLP